MTHVINLFYPRFDNTNDPEHNKVPENCLFLKDCGESVLALIVTNNQKNCTELHYANLNFLMYKIPSNLKWKA